MKGCMELKNLFHLTPSVIALENVGSNGKKVLRQKNINEALFKNRTQQVQQYVGDGFMKMESHSMLLIMIASSN